MATEPTSVAFDVTDAVKSIEAAQERAAELERDALKKRRRQIGWFIEGAMRELVDKDPRNVADRAATLELFDVLRAQMDNLAEIEKRLDETAPF